MRAQSYFTAASVNTQETPVGVATVNSRCIGNDIMYINGDLYSVNVWDDLNNQCGIAWEVDDQSTIYTGNTSFQNSNDIIDPDVALAYDGADIYALVAYHDFGADEYYLDIFTWQPSPTFAFTLSSSTNFYSGPMTTTLNLDTDGSTGFAIVIDRNTKILAFTGSVSSGSASFNNSGNPVQIGAGYYPDLCIFRDASDYVVHLTYVADNSGTLDNLIINHHLFSALSSGNGTPANYQSITPGTGDFHFPRIACPNGSILGDKDDYTVVVQETDGNTYNIVGFNDGSPSTPIYYNDGNFPSPYPINTEPNYLPVVTYDDQNQVWVGWILDNIANSLPTYISIFPIALKCDFDAQIIGSTYWEVPDYLQDGDEIVLLALAGRFGNDQLLATFHTFISQTQGAISEEIYYKQIVPSTAGGFRLANTVGVQSVGLTKSSKLSGFFPQENSKISIFDLTGRFIGSLELNVGSSVGIANHLHEFCPPGSVYVLRTERNGEIFNSKFVSIH